MKIVCDACSAKYSIADEKVRGKVFKIRCKKCSNIIVVRGDADAVSNVGDPPGGAAEPASDGAVWHVVIDEDQVGPMTVADLRERYARGEIDSESYVWREGFEDWQRLADVSEIGLGSDSSETQVAATGAAAAGMFGGPALEDTAAAQSDPRDLFSSQSGVGIGPGGGDGYGGGDSAAVPMAAAPSDSAGVGLFGTSNGASAGGGGGLQVESQLKGQRNESSVLFSLGNLASLANEAPKASGTPSPSTSSSATTAGGATEGSGLIDIRSMASVYLGDKADSKASGSVDDLPVFATSSFEAVSPVLLPSSQPAATDKKLLYGLIGVIAFLLIAALVLVVALVTGGDDDGKTELAAASVDAHVAETAEPETAAPTPDDGTSAEDKTAATEPATEATPTKTTAPATHETTADNHPTHTSRNHDRDRDRNHTRTHQSTRTKEPEPKPEPKETSDSGGCDEVSCLVTPNKACCRKYSGGGGGGGGGSSASSNLPASPSRDNVKAGVRQVTSRVAACGRSYGGSGIVKVRFKIAPSGRVSSASAATSNGALGSCIERAVKRAHFEKSKRGLPVSYPFVF